MKNEINEIDKHQTIGSFLNEFPNYKTRQTYKSGITKYFSYLNKNPDEYICKNFRLLENDERIKIEDQYEDDITGYWNWLIRNGKPPKTVNTYLAVVRVFLQHHKIYLENNVWDKLNKRGIGNGARTQDEPINNEILEKILTHGDVKSRALFLVLSSSGMRLGECLQLTKDDINLKVKPTKITIRAETTKNKTERFTFISNEATRCLKEWMKERDQYLISACKKTNIKTYHGFVTKDPNDNTVFPFDECNANYLWNKLITKAGFTDKDNRTNRRKYHIHGLRKFFRTTFSKHNRDIAELLMGHNGYLNKEYVRFTETEIADSYVNGEQFLYIFDRPVADEEQQKTVEELKEQIEILMGYYKELTGTP